MKKSNQIVKKKQIGNRKAGSRTILSHPPPIQGFEVKHTVKLRFVLTSAFTGNITYQNLLDLICVATTAIAPYDLFTTVKLKQVETWAVPILGTAVSVEIAFTGISAGSAGDQITHTDTSMGIEPAHLRVRPSQKSLASNYQESSAAVAFVLAVPIGAVIDVSLVFRGGTEGQTLAAQNASVGAPVGSTFFRGLDGKALAATQFAVPNGIQQF